MKVRDYVPNVISRAVGKQVQHAKQNSPHIMFGVGLVGVIGSTVLACRATLKAADMVEEMKDEISSVKKNHHHPDPPSKELAYVYGKHSAKIAAAYAPAFLVGTLSVAALTGSHVQLTRRNAALTAAYTAVSKAYDSYRERVREEIGVERERALYLDEKEELVIGEDGSEKAITTVDPSKHSVYARFFDEYSPQWKKNAEHNRVFVTCQMNYANEILRSRGHVFLNEVYEMLGLPKSQAGQFVGWAMDNGGDNYIDFGIYDAHNSRFVNADERSILLDFNVDGVIINLI